MDWWPDRGVLPLLPLQTVGDGQQLPWENWVMFGSVLELIDSKVDLVKQCIIYSVNVKWLVIQADIYTALKTALIENIIDRFDM